MKRCLILVALGLIASSGCGEIGGGKRRQASGSVGAVGLVGSDVKTLAAAPTQNARNEAAPTQPGPGGLPPTAVPGTPGMPAGAPGGAPQPGNLPGAAPPVAPQAGAAPQAGGGLPGLPGVNLPGQPQPGVVTEKAQVGATGKGNYGGPGMVTTPISVYFQAQERLIFLQVEHAIQLYEASNGQKPKTEEEFMKQIIEANQIKLPQLPPGSKYKYDPQKGELLVERPQ